MFYILKLGQIFHFYYFYKNIKKHYLKCKLESILSAILKKKDTNTLESKFYLSVNSIINVIIFSDLQIIKIL